MSPGRGTAGVWRINSEMIAHTVRVTGVFILEAETASLDLRRHVLREPPSDSARYISPRLAKVLQRARSNCHDAAVAVDSGTRTIKHQSHTTLGILVSHRLNVCLSPVLSVILFFS